jgi:hypothetical protein
VRSYIQNTQKKFLKKYKKILDSIKHRSIIKTKETNRENKKSVQKTNLNKEDLQND